MNYTIKVLRCFGLAFTLVWGSMPGHLIGAAAPAAPAAPAPGFMDYLHNGVAATGNIALAPFAVLGSVAGVTYKAAGAVGGVAGSVLSLAMGYPLAAAGIATYSLFADDGQGLNLVGSVCNDLGKKAQDNGLGVMGEGLVSTAHTVGARAYAHLYRNKQLAAAIIAPLAVIKSWDAVLGKNGSLVLDSVFGAMVVIPADGQSGLPLANFMFDAAPDATTLYHGMLDGDKTLRAAFMLALRKGSVNNWKLGLDNVQALCLQQIDLELQRIAAMQARVDFYIPNAQDMLKEARKCAGIMTKQRHHSTQEKEQKYWDMIMEWMKDPYHAKAKPNSWLVPLQKSVEGVITSFEFKMPNVFWHIYPYYGQALLLYACLEQRKERLIALRELVEHELPVWLKEDAASHQ